MPLQYSSNFKAQLGIPLAITLLVLLADLQLRGDALHARVLKVNLLVRLRMFLLGVLHDCHAAHLVPPCLAPTDPALDERPFWLLHTPAISSGAKD